MNMSFRGRSSRQLASAAPADETPSPILPRSKRDSAVIGRMVAVTAIFGLTLALVSQTIFILETYPPEPVVSVVTFDDDDHQLVTVRPGAITMSDREILTEKYLKQYIRHRETIDHTTEISRFEKVRLFTEPEWYAVWFDQVDPRDKQSAISRYARDGLSREIRNITVAPIAGQQNTYQAEFLAIDRLGHKEVRSKKWFVSLVAAPLALTGDREAIDANPLGLTVYQYILRESANNE
jgi:type IV secretory pathway component VirB8